MYPTGAQEYREDRAESGAGTSQPARPVSSSGASEVLAGQQLSEDQKRVLDCLQSADGGLTMKQLQSSLSCSPDSLQSAIDSLVERHIVRELNTIIPSYVCRYPGIQLYEE